MTYEEIISLRDKLKTNEFTLDEATEKYLSELDTRKKSWQTKDWQDRKKSILKDKCEQCGSTEELRVHHSTFPEKYDKYYLYAYNHYYDLFFNETSIDYDNLVTKEEIENYIKITPREIYSVCPECNGGYSTRRNPPRHVCNRCKNEFDEPVNKPFPEYVDDLYKGDIIPEDKALRTCPKNRSQRQYIPYSEIGLKLVKQKIKDMVKNKYQNEIKRKAMLDCLDANIQYLSFEGTQTFCKKCGYLSTQKDMDLCPQCKNNYKNKIYPVCYDCYSLNNGVTPEQIEKEKQENKEFYRSMREMHKSLGID